MTADRNQNPMPKGPDTSPTPARPASSTDLIPRLNKPWWYRLVAMIFAPVLFFLVLEVVLRVFGFGYPTAFLLKDSQNGRKTFVQNNQFGWRFFGSQLSRPPYALSIPRPKPPDTVRIFVFGESAACGDPQPAFGLSRMLMALFSHRYPGVHFEVENTAMTGINSHAVLPIARDCAQADGDLWVIYMGNNEVVGPFGAGSVFGPQVPPLPLIHASIEFKKSRTGQLLDSLRQEFQPPGHGNTKWTGMAMFLGQQVTANDPRISRVYQHFERNLADILETGKRCGVGIVLSTVAVNLRDCPPLGSAHRTELSEPDKSNWEKFYELGAKAQAAGSNAPAAGFFQEAAKIDDAFAELRFRQGQCALALGNGAEARAQFQAARDLDTLRFRCDRPLNDAIRRAAAGREQDRFQFADAELAFSQQSRDGLPGEDFFHEHVHLTFEGNYLLAQTIADQLEKLLPPWVAQRSATREWPSQAECEHRLAWSDWSRAEALHQMLGRVTQPPFTGQLGHEVRARRIQAALEKLGRAMERGGIKEALNGCAQALAAEPDDASLYAQLAYMKSGVGDLAGAAEAATRQSELRPSNPEGWFQLGSILLQQNRLNDAAAAFEHTIKLDPHNVQAMQNHANVLLMLHRGNEALREYRRVVRIQPGFSRAWIVLGQIYAHNGRPKEAEEFYLKAVANNSDVTESAMLAGFCVSRGWLEAAATNYEEAVKLDPISMKLHLAAGKNLLDLNRYQPAIEQLREAARLKPDAIEPHLCLGNALLQQGSNAEALDQFEDVLRLDPPNELALRYARELRAKLGSGLPR